MLAVQFTALLLSPVTLTENCCCVLTCSDTLCGTTATDAATGVGVGLGLAGVLVLIALPVAQPPITKGTESTIRRMESQRWLERNANLFTASQRFIRGQPQLQTLKNVKCEFCRAS